MTHIAEPDRSYAFVYDLVRASRKFSVSGGYFDSSSSSLMLTNRHMVAGNRYSPRGPRYFALHPQSCVSPISIWHPRIHKVLGEAIICAPGSADQRWMATFTSMRKDVEHVRVRLSPGGDDMDETFLCLRCDGRDGLCRATMHAGSSSIISTSIH
jgi:hypothetical protein